MNINHFVGFGKTAGYIHYVENLDEDAYLETDNESNHSQGTSSGDDSEDVNESTLERPRCDLNYRKSYSLNIRHSGSLNTGAQPIKKKESLLRKIVQSKLFLDERSTPEKPKSTIFFLLLAISICMGIEQLYKYPELCARYPNKGTHWYLLFYTMVLGVPILQLEYFLGIYARGGIMGALERLAPGGKIIGIGVMLMCLFNISETGMMAYTHIEGFRSNIIFPTPWESPIECKLFTTPILCLHRSAEGKCTWVSITKPLDSVEEKAKLKSIPGEYFAGKIDGVDMLNQPNDYNERKIDQKACKHTYIHNGRYSRKKDTSITRYGKEVNRNLDDTHTLAAKKSSKLMNDMLNDDYSVDCTSNVENAEKSNVDGELSLFSDCSKESEGDLFELDNLADPRPDFDNDNGVEIKNKSENRGLANHASDGVSQVANNKILSEPEKERECVNSGDHTENTSMHNGIYPFDRNLLDSARYTSKLEESCNLDEVAAFQGYCLPTPLLAMAYRLFLIEKTWRSFVKIFFIFVLLFICLFGISFTDFRILGQTISVFGGMVLGSIVTVAITVFYHGAVLDIAKIHFRDICEDYEFHSVVILYVLKSLGCVIGINSYITDNIKANTSLIQVSYLVSYFSLIMSVFFSVFYQSCILNLKIQNQSEIYVIPEFDWMRSICKTFGAGYSFISGVILAVLITSRSLVFFSSENLTGTFFYVSASAFLILKSGIKSLTILDATKHIPYLKNLSKLTKAFIISLTLSLWVASVQFKYCRVLFYWLVGFINNICIYIVLFTLSICIGWIHGAHQQKQALGSSLPLIIFNVTYLTTPIVSAILINTAGAKNPLLFGIVVQVIATISAIMVAVLLSWNLRASFFKKIKIIAFSNIESLRSHFNYRSTEYASGKRCSPKGSYFATFLYIFQRNFAMILSTTKLTIYWSICIKYIIPPLSAVACIGNTISLYKKVAAQPSNGPKIIPTSWIYLGFFLPIVFILILIVWLGVYMIRCSHISINSSRGHSKEDSDKNSSGSQCVRTTTNGLTYRRPIRYDYEYSFLSGFLPYYYLYSYDIFNKLNEKASPNSKT